MNAYAQEVAGPITLEMADVSTRAQPRQTLLFQSSLRHSAFVLVGELGNWISAWRLAGSN
jgi:hypothetical protein